MRAVCTLWWTATGGDRRAVDNNNSSRRSPEWLLGWGVATEAMLLCLFACECNLQTDYRGSFTGWPVSVRVRSVAEQFACSWTWCVSVLCETGPLVDKWTCWSGGTAGHCIIVLRDVVDSYLFRMHTFHDTSHCIIGPTGSMNKHTYLLTGSCCWVFEIEALGHRMRCLD